MLLEMMVNHQITYLFAGVTTVGVMLNLMESSIYRRWLHHVARIESKPNHWMGRMKNRFECSYRMQTGVRKIDLFVRNTLDSRRFLGIRVRTWERISSQFPLIVTGLGLGAALYAVRQHFSYAEAVTLAGVGLVMGLAGLVLERIVGVTQSRERVQNALNDYFSNLLRPKYEQQYLMNPKTMAPVEKVAGEKEADEVEAEPEIAASSDEKSLRKKQLRMMEKRRRTEERAKKQREALYLAYEEKKRKLENKYQALQKEWPMEEAAAFLAAQKAGSSEAFCEAAAAEDTATENKGPIPCATKSSTAKQMNSCKIPREEDGGIDCSAENMADPDFIEAVLREYL